MARGMAAGEASTSQAATDEYRANHDRALGERKPGQRGRWVMDPATKTLVRAEDYRAPLRALDAPIIADRIHEGTTIDDGDRIVDIGSRRKRREFMRSRGVEDASDVSRSWLEAKTKEKDRAVERGTDRAIDEARRKLHYQGKWRE